MSIYINGIGNISPQKTTDPDHFLTEPVSCEGLQLKSLDPGYKAFIPADLIRRMGRIIKMGVAAAKISLREAGCDVPDAIITGTGLGCIEDTEKFLGSMIRNNEEFLTPTAFIQSTHNTVGAQIALLLKCHGYNFAYVHRGLSFESALTDAMMKLESGQVQNVLAGGIDELTDNSFAIMKRMGHWRRKPVPSGTDRFPSRGTIAGEGAAFFLLTKEKKPTSYAELKGVKMLHGPATFEEISDTMVRFLEEHRLSVRDIDLLITGRNGDDKQDHVYDLLKKGLPPDTAEASYKHLCGEYMTANAFGTWFGSMILRTQKVPEHTLKSAHPGKLDHLLLFNHYRMTDYSFILLKRI